MPIRLWTIAANTYRESIRQPVFVVLLCGASLLLMLNIAVCGYAFEDDNKLLLDLGLSTIFLAGLLLAAFTATGVFSREIENKTVLTVISKPVGRPLFVAGKFLGVAAALATACWVWTLLFMLTVRHGVMTRANDPFDEPVLLFGLGGFALAGFLAASANYAYRWVFASTFTGALVVIESIAYILVLCLGKGFAIQPPETDFDPRLWLAALLVFEALAVLCAVAVAVSTRLGQVMTLAICSAVFLLGLSSDFLFRARAEENAFAKIAYSLVPNLNFHWLAELLHREHTHLDELWPLLGLVSAYSALHVAAILALAVALFQTREVG